MVRSDLHQSILLSLGLATALFSACLGAHTLSVEGQGTVEIAPEYARIGASVSHIADSAVAAQTNVDRVMTGLLTEINKLPVDPDTVDAGHVNIQPKYRWNPRSETRELLGYEATRLLGFRLTSLDSLGETLQMLAEQGATAVQPPQYGSTLMDKARGRALTIAYEKAKRDALSLATAAGFTLGPPDTISTGSQRPPIFRATHRAAPAAVDAQMAPRYEPGQLSVSANVSVNFLASP